MRVAAKTARRRHEAAHYRPRGPGVRRSAAEGGLMPPPHCVFAAYTPHSGVAAKGAAAPVVVAAFLLCRIKAAQ